MVRPSCAGAEPGLNLDMEDWCRRGCFREMFRGGRRPGSARAGFALVRRRQTWMDMTQDRPEQGIAGAGGASVGSDKHRCVRCGMATILQTKRRYDGFTLLEEYQACGFCGARIEVAKDLPSQPGDLTAGAGKHSAVSAYLFGAGSGSSSGADASGGPELPPPPRRVDSAEARLGHDGLGDAPGGHFCRDCRHYVKHPFRSRCGRHDCEVEPMQDCPDFCRADDPSRKAKPPFSGC